LRRRLFTRKKRADRLAELLVELAAAGTARTRQRAAQRTLIGAARS
jgi:hypothetical protein